MKFKGPVPTSTIVRHLRGCGLTSEEISAFINTIHNLQVAVGSGGDIEYLSISINGSSEDDVYGEKEHPEKNYAIDRVVLPGGETEVHFRFSY
jgi:hypothetical protein